MKSKAAVFGFLLLFVFAVVIASAVSEENQVQQPDKVEAAKEAPVDESKQHCHYGCCRYYGHRCVKCCDHPAEAKANTINNQQEHDQVEANDHAWRGGGGHGGGKGGGWRGSGGHA